LVSTYFGGHFMHQSTELQKVCRNSRLQMTSMAILKWCQETMSNGTRQDLNLGHKYPVTSQMNHLCCNLREFPT
ncbi:hypothetical protein, partial [Rhizobium mesoamericanum]|uniref:hypothetical protein n=1 Tax=Rhizobium mesoamericanum TaxID=1079800 RepID=UPI000568174F